MIALALCAAGCGTSERSASSDPAMDPFECQRLTAHQVVGSLPGDYEIAPPADPKPIEAFVDQIRDEMGDAYRSHYATILGRRSESSGTVVVVINTADTSAEEVVAGAKSAEGEDGVTGEPLDIGGREGRFQRATDGSYVAVAPTGECSVLFLADENESRLKDNAALIKGPQEQ